ncbi:MAG: SPFH domain-containing protein [Candidatus Altiarchaeota archaeon]|nr:SPFH domain-containing protein [Candidatus Altiarchaeota archaeon]
MAEIPLGEGTTEEKTHAAEGGLREVDINIIERWRGVIFVLLVIAFILTILFVDKDLTIGTAVEINLKYSILVVLTILTGRLSILRLTEYDRAVVFRMGKFHRVAGPGWEFIPPLVEGFRRVDLRLKVYNIDPQEIVTKDKIRFLVAPEVFMYVSNPKDAILNVDDYEKTVLAYVNSALTHTGGDSTSDYIVAHMDNISHMLVHSIEHISTSPGKEWGVVVPKIKLGFIRFPDEVQFAMHKRAAAEQLKLAAHEKADATKIELDAIREAGSKLTDPAITYLYLEALDKMASGKATKIVLPLELSRIAESITKRTGALSSAPEIDIPPDLIQKYTDTLSKYDDRLKGIEDKLTEKKDAIEVKPERVGEAKTEKKETKEELDEYKKRIREIKRRVGIS